MNKTISPKITALTFGILTVAFLAVFYVVAWQEPAQAPPGGNVATPLNIGPTGQSKEGGLILNTGGAVNGLIIDQGNLCLGVDCRSSWPSITESDPQVGTLNNGKWCTSDGNLVNCTSNAPSAGPISTGLYGWIYWVDAFTAPSQGSYPNDSCSALAPGVCDCSVPPNGILNCSVNCASGYTLIRTSPVASSIGCYTSTDICRIRDETPQIFACYKN